VFSGTTVFCLLITGVGLGKAFERVLRFVVPLGEIGSTAWLVSSEFWRLESIGILEDKSVTEVDSGAGAEIEEHEFDFVPAMGVGFGIDAPMLFGAGAEVIGAALELVPSVEVRAGFNLGSWLETVSRLMLDIGTWVTFGPSE